MSPIRLDQYRIGRNYIRPGDTVRAKPSPRHNSFETKVIAIHGDAEGNPTGVEVRDPRTGNVRILRPEVITRKARTKSPRS